MHTPFDNAADALAFLLGGNARFTLESTKTGKRYTYRMRKSEDEGAFFASTLVGSNNSSDYAYVGYSKANWIELKGRVVTPQFTALRWTLAQLVAGRIPENLKVWHDGACGRCARPLTVPSSVASGFGPECIKYIRPTCKAA